MRSARSHLYLTVIGFMRCFVNDTEEAVIASREGTEGLAFWGKRKEFTSFLYIFCTVDLFNHVYR